jgi:hypothetical protein
MRRLLLLLAVLALPAACAQQHGESYGFVATLGNDTTSVERVTRTGNHIVSDAVGRSPAVTRRHWEAELGPDGSIKKWSMDTYIPNAPADRQHLHHSAEFKGQSVSLSRGTSADTRTFAYKTTYVATVPWNAFVYASYEPLLDAAKRQGDSARIGQYFFEGWDEGHIGYAVVKRDSDGSYSLESTGLAGAGSARLDSSGHLLSYSGQGTTYKQEVHRVTSVPDIDSLTTRFAADEQRKGVAWELSPRGIAHATVGSATITIDYGRPARRGRKLVGELIPYDDVWRTGANAATQLTTSEPIRLAGVPLKAGTYTLWTLPTTHGVQLIINGQSGQWGTDYDEARDVARRPMTVDSASSNMELFTISVTQDSTRNRAPARLLMEWGTFRWSVPLEPTDRYR